MPRSFRMKMRTSPFWPALEMKSNAVGLTLVVRPSRTAVRAAGRMGHSSSSRPCVRPQIEVEQGGERRGRRRRNEVAARIEAAGSDESMQRLRREVRNDAREEWRIQQSRESIFDRAPVAGR